MYQKDACEHIVKIPKETHTTRKNYRSPKIELDLSEFWYSPPHFTYETQKSIIIHCPLGQHHRNLPKQSGTWCRALQILYFLQKQFFFVLINPLNLTFRGCTVIVNFFFHLHFLYSNMHCQFSSVQSLSHVRLFATPWTAACQASHSITTSWSLLKLMSIESVMPSNHLILCCSLFLPPSVFPSIRVFSNESVLHIRWPKYWSFSFSISPSNEHPGPISFRTDWLDILAVQGTLKSLLQHHSSKASILRLSAFFTVQLSQPYSLSEAPWEVP